MNSYKVIGRKMLDFYTIVSALKIHLMKISTTYSEQIFSQISDFSVTPIDTVLFQRSSLSSYQIVQSPIPSYSRKILSPVLA